MNSTGVTEEQIRRSDRRSPNLGLRPLDAGNPEHDELPGRIRGSGLVARYAMDETSGDTIISTAGPTVNGTLVNGVFRTTGAPFDANVPPIISAISPNDGITDVTGPLELSANVSDLDTNSVTVTFYSRKVATTVNAPDFTVVALPDTHYYSENVGGNRAAIFSAQTDWIVAQKDFLNIAFVMHLGDVTDHGDNPRHPRHRMGKREASHVSAGESCHDATSLRHPAQRSTSATMTSIRMATTTTAPRLTSTSSSASTPTRGIIHFVGKAITYRRHLRPEPPRTTTGTLFSASGLDFIVISMESFAAPDQVDLGRADALLKAYPNRRAIMVSHHTVNTGNPASFSPMGTAMYNALKDNPNLMMMHGGHIHGEGRRADTTRGARYTRSYFPTTRALQRRRRLSYRILTFKPSRDQIRCSLTRPPATSTKPTRTAPSPSNRLSRAVSSPFVPEASTRSSSTGGNAACDAVSTSRERHKVRVVAPKS